MYAVRADNIGGYFIQGQGHASLKVGNPSFQQLSPPPFTVAAGS